jgi:hypothetical protein
MWTYPDLQTRKTTRENAWQVDGWSETVYKTGKGFYYYKEERKDDSTYIIIVRLVESMQSHILKPLDFSPLK